MKILMPRRIVVSVEGVQSPEKSKPQKVLNFEIFEIVQNDRNMNIYCAIQQLNNIKHFNWKQYEK